MRPRTGEDERGWQGEPRQRRVETEDEGERAEGGKRTGRRPGGDREEANHKDVGESSSVLTLRLSRLLRLASGPPEPILLPLLRLLRSERMLTTVFVFRLPRGVRCTDPGMKRSSPSSSSLPT